MGRIYEVGPRRGDFGGRDIRYRAPGREAVGWMSRVRRLHETVQADEDTAADWDWVYAQLDAHMVSLGGHEWGSAKPGPAPVTDWQGYEVVYAPPGRASVAWRPALRRLTAQTAALSEPGIEVDEEEVAEGWEWVYAQLDEHVASLGGAPWDDVDLSPHEALHVLLAIMREDPVPVAGDVSPANAVPLLLAIYTGSTPTEDEQGESGAQS